MALLPGSAAIGAGAAVSSIAGDQRGAPRPTSGAVDIGAFQDQGYTVAVSSGSPQSAPVNQVFNSPLVALLTENFAKAPLPGSTIGFSAPSSGASAKLSASAAFTDAMGLASVIARANATAGTYAVTASATGVTSPASYNLTNQIQPSFSGLAGQTINYGNTVTFTGTLAAGSQVPAGEEVAITVDGVTHDATIASDGSFSTQFTSAHGVLNASPTAYVVNYDYATDGVFLGADGSSQLTVNPEALTITAVANTKIYDGTTAAAAVPTITLGSLGAGDTANFTETYNTRNVGAGLTLTPIGTVDDGNGGSNYTYTFVPVATGVITAEALTITGMTNTKTYDGTTSSAAVPIISAGSLASGDTADFTESYSTRNVGMGLALTPSGTVDDGNGGNNYIYTFVPVATGVITAEALTITGMTNTKTYDGTTSAAAVPTITSGSLGTGDTPDFHRGVQQRTQNVGKSLTLTPASGTLIDGNGGNNYTYTFVPVSTGVINAAGLTITAVTNTKVYDSTISAASVPTVSGLQGTDTVTGLSEAYNTKNAGTNKMLSVAMYTVNDGNGGNNYTVTTVSNDTGGITSAPLTITGVTNTKT